MKKSSLFKILTLFLTFVIFSCCSGCLFVLCLQLKENEERRQHLIEKQKERKAQADALIPEIDGYIFEALPEAAFANQEDWESKGFLDNGSFFNWRKESYYYYEKQETELNFIFNVKTQDHELFNRITIKKDEYEERLAKFFEVFSECTAFEESIICKDGEFFLVSWMPYISRGELYSPPALFLLNFDNNTMFYIGYDECGLEYEIENGKFYTNANYCYKLTKRGGIYEEIKK
jgi:hypothetical protein